MTLHVEGMTCSGCEQRLSKALRRVDGVREAAADHRTGEVRVRFDPSVTAPRWPPRPTYVSSKPDHAS